MSTQDPAIKPNASDEPTLKEKTAKGLFWGGVSNFVQQVIGMAFGIAIARILSPDDYGLVAMLAIFTAVANTVMDSGFTTTLINRPTIEHRDYNAVFWFNVFVGVGMYIALFFAAPLISRFYEQPVLIPLARVLFLTFIISATGVAHNALLLKKIMAKQRGIIDMAAVFCSGTVGLILALSGFAFWGLVIQQLSQILITVLLRWYFSSWRPTFEFDWRPLKEMFGFGIKVFITNIFSQITYNLMSLILGKVYGKTITGHYAQGAKWAMLGNNVIVTSLNNIAQPVLVETRDDSERQLNVFRKMVRFGAFITFPALLGLAFVGEEFVMITIGVKWMASVPFLQLFCLWGINSYLSALYISLAFSHGKSDLYLNIMTALFIAQLLSLLVCYYLSVDIFVMTAVYVGVYIFSTLFWHRYTSKLIGVRKRDVIKDLLPYFVITIFAIAVSWLAAMPISNIYLRFAVKIIVMAAVYIAILSRMNSVIFRESMEYFKLVRR